MMFKHAVPIGSSSFDLGLTNATSEIISAAANANGVMLTMFMMSIRINGPGQCYADIGTVRFAYMGENSGLVYTLPYPILIPPGSRLFIGAQGAGEVCNFNGRYKVL